MRWLLLRSVLVGGAVYLFGASFFYMLHPWTGDLLEAAGMSSPLEQAATLYAAHAFVLGSGTLVGMLVQSEVGRRSSVRETAVAGGASLIGGSAIWIALEGWWWPLMALVAVPAALVLVLGVLIVHRVSDATRRTRMLTVCSIALCAAGAIVLFGPIHELLRDWDRADARRIEESNREVAASDREIGRAYERAGVGRQRRAARQLELDSAEQSFVEHLKTRRRFHVNPASARCEFADGKTIACTAWHVSGPDDTVDGRRARDGGPWRVD